MLSVVDGCSLSSRTLKGLLIVTKLDWWHTGSRNSKASIMKKPFLQLFVSTLFAFFFLWPSTMHGLYINWMSQMLFYMGILPSVFIWSNLLVIRLRGRMTRFAFFVVLFMVLNRALVLGLRSLADLFRIADLCMRRRAHSFSQNHLYSMCYSSYLRWWYDHYREQLTDPFRESLKHKNIGQTKFIKTELTKIRYKIK